MCAGLILITPFNVIARENNISSNISEQPDVKELITQLRVVVNEILQKYGHIPKIANLCNLILDTLNLIGKIMYCIVLYMIFIPTVILTFTVTFILIILNLPQHFSIYLFFLSLVIAFTLDTNCPPGTPFFDLSYKSIYTVLETNDITNFVNDCPCMQE